MMFVHSKTPLCKTNLFITILGIDKIRYEKLHLTIVVHNYDTRRMDCTIIMNCLQKTNKYWENGIDRQYIPVFSYFKPV